MTLKTRLRELAAKAIKRLAPILADAVAKEVRRRAGAPAKGEGPFHKAGLKG